MAVARFPGLPQIFRLVGFLRGTLGEACFVGLKHEALYKT